MSKNLRPYVLSVIFDSEGGALDRIIGLFSGRGYALESITFGKVNDHVSRMTLVCMAKTEDRSHINQIMLQLSKLVPVHRVRELTEDSDRNDVEVTLLRLDTSIKHHAAVKKLFDQNRITTWRIAATFVHCYCVNFSELRLDELVKGLEQFGNVAIARSGLISLGGPNVLHGSQV